MSSNAAQLVRDVYKLAFEKSPIILVGGIVSGMPGGMYPIIGLLGQLAAFVQAATSTTGIGLDSFFADFVTIPGGMFINNEIGTVPFASQQIGANSIIPQALPVSLKMIAPVKNAGGYVTKLPIFTSLRNSLKAHNDAGGRYHIATPSFIYSNCVMKTFMDITPEEMQQKQIIYQLDFVKYLVTGQDAQASNNSLMKKITGGNEVTNSNWSSAASSTGGAGNLVSFLMGQISTFSIGG